MSKTQALPKLSEDIEVNYGSQWTEEWAGLVLETSLEA
jgi:hypothetical protein